MTKEQAYNLINELNGKIADAPQEVREYFMQYYTQAVTDLYAYKNIQNYQQSEKPYKVGYFTGTFDLAHFGHLSTIMKATQLCDKLIVSVSTDDVVKSYKHQYPVEPFIERLFHVSNIKGVALAIPQESLYDKIEICEKYGADVIFTSEEYKAENYEDLTVLSDKQLKGIERWEIFEEEAQENNIDIVYIDRIKGADGRDMSSTDLKQIIADRNNLQSSQGIMLYSEGECFDEPVFAL